MAGRLCENPFSHSLTVKPANVVQLTWSQDNPDPTLFAQEIRNCAGGTVTLGLWNANVPMGRAPMNPSCSR